MAHLLDQHVQVLRDIGGEACCEITLSVHDRTEAFVYFCAFFSRPAHILKSCYGRHRASGVSALQRAWHRVVEYWLFGSIVRFYSKDRIDMGRSDWVNRTAGLEDTQNAVT